MATIEQAVTHVDGVRTFYRHTLGAGDGEPVLFVHGNPTDSEDFEPFMHRLRRPAIALDLPGWGASEAPDPERFDYSMWGLATFFQRFCDRLGIGDHSLVVHDWGSLALIAAQRRADQVRRLAIINAVPLLPGYRWHWVARYAWRVPRVGELANAATTRSGLELGARRAIRDPEQRRAWADQVWASWPRGPRRPMLELYRSGDPDRLAAAGEQLERLACPALVLWGTDDQYLPPRFAQAYGERLPDSAVVEVDGAGHWPWLERPDSIETVCEFLERPVPAGA